MDLLLTYQWEIFIGLEVCSIVFLLAFLIIRYAFAKEMIGRIFLLLFILFILLEAVLAGIIYKLTGEISTFQIVIALFVIYAFTFGIADFKKLDRYIKGKVGKWRGIELLTEEDKRKIELLKNPKVIARNYRTWWYVHTAVFIIAHWIFWMNYGNTAYPLIHYVQDLSWFDGDNVVNTPFINEAIMQVSQLWIIIYAVDTIISWSYTFFPNKPKQEE